MNKPKKIVLSAILLLVLIGGICAANSRQILSVIYGIKASDAPVITNAFIDKEKYFPGDIMAITAETKDALEVKAFIENENGFNEVGLVMTVTFNNKETWLGKWKVENSLTGKKYKLKIVASNKSGTAETVLEWEDPNPGHPWSQIDNFPAACPAGQFTRWTGADLACATPVGAPSTWNCTVSSQTNTNTFGNGFVVVTRATCAAGLRVGGGCVTGDSSKLEAAAPDLFNPNQWYCRAALLNGETLRSSVICCQ